MQPTPLVETPQLGLEHLMAVMNILCGMGMAFQIAYGLYRRTRHIEAPIEIDMDAVLHGVALGLGMDARKAKNEDLAEMPEYDDLELGIAHPTDGELVMREFKEKS